MRIPAFIPTVTATEPLPSSIPITARPETAGLVERSIGAAGLEVERSAVIISRTWGAVERAKQAQERVVKLAEIGEQAEMINGDVVNELKRAPDPDNHYDLWNRKYVEGTKHLLDDIKDPATMAAAMVELKRIQIREGIEQKHYANRLWVEAQQGRTERLLDGYAQKEDEEGGMALIDAATANGVYPANVAERIKLGFRDSLARAREKNAYGAADAEIQDNPWAVEKTLGKPEYSILSDEKRTVLRNKADGWVTRFENKAAKVAKDASEQLYGEMVERIRKSDEKDFPEVEEEVYRKGPGGDRTLTKADFDGLLSRFEGRRKAEKESDPEVLMNVTIMANAAHPIIDEVEIAQLMRSGRLNVKDGEKAMDQVRTTNRILKDESLTAANQRYHDARDSVREGLGVSGMMLQLQEKIDPTQQGLIARAYDELWDRSVGRGGKEDPMMAARDLLPRYQRALKGQNLLSIETYQKLIDIGRFPTEQSLLDSRGALSESDFYRRARAYREMREKERINEVIDRQVKEEFGRKAK